MIRSSRFSSYAAASVLLFALFALSAAGVFAQQATPPLPLPSPFTPIVDQADVIDAATRQKLETIFYNLKQRADIEFAVVTVPTTGDLDIFDYSLALARGWGIGSKEGDKAGFLLVVAINDRKYFTQVSDHLEGDLPDGAVGQMQRERLVPQFKRQNYSQGIYDTIQAYIATLGQKRGFSIEGIDQSYAYRESAPPTSSGGIPGGCCTILIILGILIFIISAANRSGPRGGRGGGGGLLTGLILGSLANSGSRGSSWGGSSSGWGGGGFGGGGGGGFGGGGSFGGGGAGGGW